MVKSRPSFTLLKFHFSINPDFLSPKTIQRKVTKLWNYTKTTLYHKINLNIVAFTLYLTSESKGCYVIFDDIKTKHILTTVSSNVNIKIDLCHVTIGLFNELIIHCNFATHHNTMVCCVTFYNRYENYITKRMLIYI